MQIAAQPTIKTLLLLTAVYAALIAILEIDGIGLKAALFTNVEFQSELIGRALAAFICWTIPFALALVFRPRRVGLLCGILGFVCVGTVWLLMTHTLSTWLESQATIYEFVIEVYYMVFFALEGTLAISDVVFSVLPDECRQHQPLCLYTVCILGQIAYGFAGYLIARTFRTSVRTNPNSPA